VVWLGVGDPATNRTYIDCVSAIPDLLKGSSSALSAQSAVLRAGSILPRYMARDADDVEAVLDRVRELARFENLEHEVVCPEEVLYNAGQMRAQEGQINLALAPDEETTLMLCSVWEAQR